MRRWREASANALHECDWMIVLYECYKKNIKIKQKEWHTATKPLTFNVIIWDEMLSSGMKCYHLG
jgi:hypothetical protein